MSIDVSKILPPRSVIYIGTAKYHGAPNDRHLAKIVVLNHEMFALLFSCDTEHRKLASLLEEERSPLDRARLEYYLQPLIRDKMEDPFLDTLADAFEEDEIRDWTVYANYVNDRGLMQRGLIFFPGEDIEYSRPLIEYVSPLLTGTREKGPIFDLEFENK